MSKALVSHALTTVLVATLCGLGAGVAHAQQPRPNILIIWGDDIGVHNVSAYTHAIMGYRTPNIDRMRGKARSSPTPTRSRAARPAARRLSWVSIRSGRAC
jgi:hypothetical protein